MPDYSVRIVVEDEPIPGTMRGSRERAATLTGDRETVAEIVGLYQLARHCIRYKLKPKQFARLVQDAANELWPEEADGGQRDEKPT